MGVGSHSQRLSHPLLHLLEDVPVSRHLLTLQEGLPTTPGPSGGPTNPSWNSGGSPDPSRTFERAYRLLPDLRERLSTRP